MAVQLGKGSLDSTTKLEKLGPRILVIAHQPVEHLLDLTVQVPDQPLSSQSLGMGRDQL